MKIRLAGLILFLAFLFCTAASANSWGLNGQLLAAVMKHPVWDDYHTLSNQEGPFAVMQSHYHHALFFVDEQQNLHVYTTAVYQPGAKKTAPKLILDGRCLTIRYGGDESYTFCDWHENGEYQLAEAAMGSFRLTGVPGEEGYSWRYRAEEDGRSDVLVLPEKIMLSNFNISLFPHSLDEVRHLNFMHARFESGLNVLGTSAGSGDAYDIDHPGELLQPGKKGTAAVYSSPYGRSAWRAGKGKAAVGLGGELWLLSLYRNEDGQSYACIRYDVSARTQRIGYALCSDLGLPGITEQSTEPGHSFVHIDVEAAADTFLTDDPDVSQYQQLAVPRGTQFSCLGLYNDAYAYVSAEVKNGRFTDGGSVVWGFVPIRDLKPMEQETLTDVMDRLAGDWMLEAGGSLAGDVLCFRADGTFSMPSGYEDIVPESNCTGTWYVTEYHPFMNLYWRPVSYEMTLLYDSGRAAVLGLELTDSGFSLVFWDGGAGYIPWDGTTEEDHGGAASPLRARTPEKQSAR